MEHSVEVSRLTMMSVLKLIALETKNCNVMDDKLNIRKSAYGQHKIKTDPVYFYLVHLHALTVQQVICSASEITVLF